MSGDEDVSTVPHNYAINPAGKAVGLTDNQLEAASGQGYEGVSGTVARALAKANEDAKYVDQNWGTTGKAAAGLASGLSLGLAPSIAARLGIVDPGHLEAAEQSGAFTAGDVAGMIAPTILSGGEGLAARGLGRLAGEEGSSLIARALRYGTPAGLLGEAGGAAERLAGHFAGEAGLLGKLGTPALKMAARGATEGAVINIAHTVSENIIQNKPFTAQAILASGADGALFGGLTGGILGGASAAAGAGIDLIGGRVASRVGANAEGNAARALERMGASKGEIQDMAQKEGGLVNAIKGQHDVLANGAATLASDTGTIRRVAKEQMGKFEAVANDAVKQLQDESPAILNGRLNSMTGRLQEIADGYKGTMQHGEAKAILANLNKKLKGMKTWDNWATTRNQLADETQEVVKRGGFQADIYKNALSAFDSELSDAMQKANPELATQFAAATQGARTAREMVDMSSRKLVDEQSVRPLHMDKSDAATLGFSMLTGANPLVAGGIMAAKHIAAHVQSKMEPYLAEAAYRSAIGAEAGAATVNIGKKISDTLGSFMSGGRRIASKEHATPKLSYSPRAYQDALQSAEDLTSQAHQAKVRETTDALAQAGHPELADEMAQTYGRAVAYINANKPKGTHTAEHKIGQLGKVAKQLGLNTAEQKFVRILHAAKNPVDATLNALERGDISRDAVATVHFIFPDFMQRVNETFAQKVMEMKEAGKSLPADKITLAGLILNYPVDSKLQKPYIDEVQKGLAANQAPAPDQGQAPPPNTDISSYQTPLQNSIG